MICGAWRTPVLGNAVNQALNLLPCDALDGPAFPLRHKLFESTAVLSHAILAFAVWHRPRCSDAPGYQTTRLDRPLHRSPTPAAFRLTAFPKLTWPSGGPLQASERGTALSCGASASRYSGDIGGRRSSPTSRHPKRQTCNPVVPIVCLGSVFQLLINTSVRVVAVIAFSPARPRARELTTCSLGIKTRSAAMLRHGAKGTITSFDESRYFGRSVTVCNNM